MRLIDLVGQRYGRLLVLKRKGRKNNQVIWTCRCDCGKRTVVSSNDLRKPHGTVSCGCQKRERSRLYGKSLRRHGESKPPTPEFKCWMSMRQRCLKPTHQSYGNYGGRGIKICEQWLKSYENFLADMGRRPSPGHSLDRINVNGNYEPGNCRWATEEEQNSNKRKVASIEQFTDEELLAEIERRRLVNGVAVMHEIEARERAAMGGEH